MVKRYRPDEGRKDEQEKKLQRGEEKRREGEKRGKHNIKRRNVNQHEGASAGWKARKKEAREQRIAVGRHRLNVNI